MFKYFTSLSCFLLHLLRANYVGTRNLLDLAADMPKLHVFLHTSTYFVNSHLPRHSVVKEEIYRLPIYLPTEGELFVDLLEYVGVW